MCVCVCTGQCVSVRRLVWGGLNLSVLLIVKYFLRHAICPEAPGAGHTDAGPVLSLFLSLGRCRLKELQMNDEVARIRLQNVQKAEGTVQQGWKTNYHPLTTAHT